ncbi:MAG: efflux RND transporter periplasmic adaptor subunit [Epsilonproteobacteria bacterium]|nr:efflux RND transporter periplasmic adaptor subunit [Campylobacterota bacterium]
MKNIYKYIIILTLVAIAAFVFYNKVYIPKTTYATQTPKVEDMDIDVFGIGVLGAKDTYNVSAGVNAKILSLNSDEGLWVKKGQLLAVLDSVDLPIQLEETKMIVTKAKSEFIASTKELKSLDAQKNLAQLTFKRYEKLKSQSFVSQSEYDKVKADLTVIQAQIQATKAHITSSKTEIARAKKSVQAVQEKLSRYKVYAPVDGYIISKKAEIGQALLPTQTIFSILKKEDVWVKAYVDERISGSIQIGNKAIITLRSNPDKKYKAYVKRIAPQSDMVTQEREVDVSFENLPNPFYINEQAEVSISVKHLKNVVTVDATLIVYEDKKSGVWVKEQGKAHFKEIKLIAINDGRAAVKNLDKNEILLKVSEKNKSLKEGMKVH